MRRLYNILFGETTYYYDPLVRTNEEGLKMVTIYKHHPGLKPKVAYTYEDESYEVALWCARLYVKRANYKLTWEDLLNELDKIH